MAADIHSLELAFAKNPTLEACIPLCEAYLGNKRFMEAMVVCKKGIKQAPQDPRGRVLLAQVYFNQGKLPKAEQELKGALEAFPGNPNASEMMGDLLVQQGRNQEALPFLQQALTADPNLERARGLLAQLGVAAPQVAAPQAAPAMPQPPAQPPAGMQPPPQPGMQPPPQPGMQPPPQPGMQPPQPGMQPPPMQPPQQPGMQPAPHQNPWAGGSSPELPVQPAQPMPDGLPQLGVQPQEEAPKLEHVSDFFAEETLGFGDDGGHIETAGPGRLTILGFVPKSTGSIKTTIVVALALFAIASIIVVYQYVSSENRREIAKLQADVKAAFDEDKYVRYLDGLRTAQKILKIDDSEEDTLAAMAYAEAALASDHHEEGALERAKAYYQRCVEADGQNIPNAVAAKLLVAYHEKKYDEGLAEIDRVKKKGGTATAFEIEAYRLMAAARPDDKETKRQRQRLIESLTFHARGFALLGWDAYNREDWGTADRNFDDALKNSKDHPGALIGQALTDLDRNIGIEERQKEIEAKIKKVFALPKDELSPPILAKAHFARAQLYQWQKKTKEADADYKKAFSLDPGNAMFHLARGRGQMNLGKWDDAIASLREAGKAEPNNPAVFKKMCKAYTQVGRFKDAEAACKRAEEIAGGKDYEARYFECERLRLSRKLDDAMKCYLAIPIEAGGDLYARARISGGKALRAQKKWNDAALHMTEFLEKMPAGVQPPRIAEAWCELGQAYEGGKNKNKAIDCYTYGVEQYPLYGKCHAYLCFAMPNREAETKEACKRYLKVEPRGELVPAVEKRIRKLR